MKKITVFFLSLLLVVVFNSCPLENQDFDKNQEQNQNNENEKDTSSL